MKSLDCQLLSTTTFQPVAHSANPPRRVACVGFFDGVHLGHVFVLQQLHSLAAKRGWQPLVVTFSAHPLAVLRPTDAPQLLTSKEERLQHFAAQGIELCLMLNFCPATAALSAREFMKILHEEWGVDALLVGYDHRFGRPQAGEDFSAYQQYGRELGLEVLQAPAYEGEAKPSSSAVRKALQAGDVQTATQLLGREYSVQGKVVHGFQNGRKIGYPTANMAVAHSQQLLPKEGSYATRILVRGKLYEGMTNIGRRPTFDNGEQLSVETHIFDFADDIYEQPITLFFVAHLRDEQRFAGIEALCQQLASDAQIAREKLLSFPMKSDFFALNGAKSSIPSPEEERVDPTPEKEAAESIERMCPLSLQQPPLSGTRAFGATAGILLLFFVAQLLAVLPIVIAHFSDGQLVHFLTHPVEVADLYGWGMLGSMLLVSGLLWIFGGISPQFWKGNGRTQPKESFIWVLSFLFLGMGLNFLLQPLQLNDNGIMAQFNAMKSALPMLLVMTIAAPIFEELVFREGILRTLSRVEGLHRYVPLVISAACFSVVHGNLAQAVPAFILGCYLGLLYQRTQHILLSGAAHVCNNTLACTLLLFPSLNAKLEALSTTNSLLLGVTLFMIGIYSFSYSAKRTPPTHISQ